MSQSEIIRTEIEKIITETKAAVQNVKGLALSEAWKILQLLVALVVRVIENLGANLTSPEKKQIALEMIEKFYDTVIVVVDIPWVPAIAENILHEQIKKIIMIFVSSAIDSTVTIFREIGLFKEKVDPPSYVSVSSAPAEYLVTDFVNNVRQILRKG